MAGNSQIQGQSVASKLVRILAVFTADHPRLRASDVCRRSGLPFSTVHRLLAELAGSGVLHRSPDGTYAVGIRLWQLAASHPQVRSLRASALPAMSVLYASADASVFLDVIADDEGLCIEEIRRPDDGGFRHGTRFPLRATAGGQVLLAYAEIRTLTGPRPVDERLPSDERLQQIMRVRRAGVAVSTAAGRLAMAAPVFGGAGTVIASLEVAAAPCADRVGLARAVRRAAADVSDRLATIRPVGTMSAYPLSGYALDDRSAS
jgi:DNA-binding IclR family transcriptional regulator